MTSLEEFRARLKAEREAKEKPFPLTCLLIFLERTQPHLLYRTSEYPFDTIEMICKWLSPIVADAEFQEIIVPRFNWNYTLNKIAQATGISDSNVYQTYWHLKGIHHDT